MSNFLLLNFLHRKLHLFFFFDCRTPDFFFYDRRTSFVFGFHAHIHKSPANRRSMCALRAAICLYTNGARCEAVIRNSAGKMCRMSEAAAQARMIAPPEASWLIDWLSASNSSWCRVQGAHTTKSCHANMWPALYGGISATEPTFLLNILITTKPGWDRGLWFNWP